MTSNIGLQQRLFSTLDGFKYRHCCRKLKGEKNTPFSLPEESGHVICSSELLLIVAGVGISVGKQAGITLHIDLLDITSDAGLIKKGPG